MFDKELRAFFDPAVYSVPEGENQVLVLRTDNEFAIPFTIDVTLRDVTAVGKYTYIGVHFIWYTATSVCIYCSYVNTIAIVQCEGGSNL